MTIHLTTELIRRVDANEHAYTLGRMRARGDRPGLEGRAFGRALALVWRDVPNPYFNRVLGFTHQDIDQLAAIDGFYGDVRYSVEVPPGGLDTKVGKALAALGFTAVALRPVLVAELPTLKFNKNEGQDDIEAVMVQDSATLEQYKDAYLRGWAIEPSFATGFRLGIDGWAKTPGWHLFVARRGGVAIAAATLFLGDGIAYLADATTDPVHRGVGAQRALLSIRIAHARKLGAALLTSRADFASTSMRNMERAGLPCAYVKTIWERS